MLTIIRCEVSNVYSVELRLLSAAQSLEHILSYSTEIILSRFLQP